MTSLWVWSIRETRSLMFSTIFPRVDTHCFKIKVIVTSLQNDIPFKHLVYQSTNLERQYRLFLSPVIICPMSPVVTSGSRVLCSTKMLK